VHGDRAVGFEQDQPLGGRKPGAQPAFVLDRASRHDQPHGPRCTTAADVPDLGSGVVGINSGIYKERGRRVRIVATALQVNLVVILMLMVWGPRF
jgi:hypothetical protein